MLLWFFLVFTSLILFDLLYFSEHQLRSFKTSMFISVAFIVIGLLFGVMVMLFKDYKLGIEYTTGFFVEKILALDNIFVIKVIFDKFGIEPKYQSKTLTYGILGALIFRLILISLGIEIINSFYVLMYFVALILIITGLKLLFTDKGNKKIKDNFIIIWLKSKDRYTENHRGKFWLYDSKGRVLFTCLFAALITIEVTDLIFALDSIPAILGISNDRFVLYTSNIFAILGIRALYFCVRNLVEKLYYLRYSIAVLLVVVGLKIFLSHFVQIPVLLVLALTTCIFTIGVVASLVFPRKY